MCVDPLSVYLSVMYRFRGATETCSKSRSTNGGCSRYCMLQEQNEMFLTYTLSLSLSEEQTDTSGAAGEGSIPPQESSDTKTTPPEQAEATPTTGNEGAEPEKPAESSKPPEKAPEAKKPKKPTVRSVDLPIAEQTTSLSKKQLDDMREKEVCV